MRTCGECGHQYEPREGQELDGTWYCWQCQEEGMEEALQFCSGCERPIALADPGHPYGGHAAQCEFNPNPPMNSNDYDPSVWD